MVELGGQRSIPHWPSTYILSFNSRPPQDTKGDKLLEPKGDYCMQTLSTILGSTIGMVTHGQKKFTWPRQWESMFVPSRRSTYHCKPKNLLSLEVWKEICER